MCCAPHPCHPAALAKLPTMVMLAPGGSAPHEGTRMLPSTQTMTLGGWGMSWPPS